MCTFRVIQHPNHIIHPALPWALPSQLGSIKETSVMQNSPGRCEDGRTGGVGLRGTQPSGPCWNVLNSFSGWCWGFWLSDLQHPLFLTDQEKEEAEALRASMVKTEPLGAEKSPKGDLSEEQVMQPFSPLPHQTHSFLGPSLFLPTVLSS